MVDTIKELSDLSRKLNQKSDTLNAVITSINEKLAKLNLGVEAWLEHQPFEMSEVKHRPDEQQCDVMYQEGKVLGYCRISGTWQLALKTCWYDIVDEGCEVEPTSLLNSEESLLKASRLIRIKALELLPQLLDQIKAGAQKMLGGIESAEKAAKKL
jgi:hypothetical protein